MPYIHVLKIEVHEVQGKHLTSPATDLLFLNPQLCRSNVIEYPPLTHTKQEECRAGGEGSKVSREWSVLPTFFINCLLDQEILAAMYSWVACSPVS